MEKQATIFSTCTSGGCGAKIGPAELGSVLGGLKTRQDKNLLVGFDASDDAAVYRIDGERAVISTVDFFSPMVDEPYLFGQIAAANALSDIYAMGGTPFLALNLICFPERFPKTILGEILAGGADKIAEAGAALGGGHSIYDKEIKYGLSVNGFTDTNKLLRNNTPEIGHMLILTKPLGVGVIMAAARGEAASAEAVEKATASMTRLNRYAAEKLRDYAVSACTDITGFGLLVHLLEMCGQRVSAELWPEQLPFLPEAAAYAGEYLLTAAGQRNRNFCGAQGETAVETLNFAVQELLFDPQTSGGLLICTDPEQAPELLKDIQKDDPWARLIGKILPHREKTILFRG